MSRDWRQLDLFPYLDPAPSGYATPFIRASRLYLLANGPLTATGNLILAHSLCGNTGLARCSGADFGSRAAGMGGGNAGSTSRR